MSRRALLALAAALLALSLISYVQAKNARIEILSERLQSLEQAHDQQARQIEQLQALRRLDDRVIQQLGQDNQALAQGLAEHKASVKQAYAADPDSGAWAGSGMSDAIMRLLDQYRAEPGNGGADSAPSPAGPGAGAKAAGQH